MPSWAFCKPQTSIACIRKVHVGIVNSVVHHPNTQSASVLVKCSVGHVNVSQIYYYCWPVFFSNFLKRTFDLGYDINSF
jgi:hypothetical protein